MNLKVKTAQEIISIILNNPSTLITGSFDIVHLGHMRFIAEAKSIEPKNLLIAIALSDEAIRARKGHARPFFTQAERVEFLTYHKDIDYVVPWQEEWEKLRDFVVQAKPKLMVVNDTDSGIANKKTVIESVGGRIEILHREEDYSTSKIIHQAKSI